MRQGDQGQMGMKAAAALLALVILVLLLRGSLFGGGDEGPSTGRVRSIPTATPPKEMPTPIILGETQSRGGTPQAGGTGGGTYVVKPGDTLQGIAISLGIPPDNQAAWIAEVLRLNNIADARLLQVGVELRLPGARATTPTATRPAGTATPAPTGAAGTATPRPTVTGGAGTYTVVAGDYPLLIAEKLGVPEGQREAWVQALLELNGVSAENLQVGQVLRLPAGTPGGGATPTPTPVP